MDLFHNGQHTVRCNNETIEGKVVNWQIPSLLSHGPV